MASDNLLDNLLGDEKIFIEENVVLKPLLEEIRLIEDIGIQNFVRTILLAIPEFFNYPITFENKDGNYIYPEDEYEVGGLVLHTKRVFRAAKTLLESQNRSKLEIDIVLAAALLHDITRIVPIGSELRVEDPMHPITVDAMFETILSSANQIQSGSSALIIEDEALNFIIRLIHTHMGIWGPISEVMPITSLEWLLHFADAIATKLSFIVDGTKPKKGRWL